MNTHRLAALVASFLALPVLAQSPGPYEGTWTVVFDGAQTSALQGTVVVQADGGTWKVLSKDRRNPCTGREAPISVRTASPDELVFVVNRSKVLPGCEDFTMKFKRVDEKALAGKTSDGRAISLTRQ